MSPIQDQADVSRPAPSSKASGRRGLQGILGTQNDATALKTESGKEAVSSSTLKGKKTKGSSSSTASKGHASGHVVKMEVNDDLRSSNRTVTNDESEPNPTAGTSKQSDDDEKIPGRDSISPSNLHLQALNQLASTAAIAAGTTTPSGGSKTGHPKLERQLPTSVVPKLTTSNENSKKTQDKKPNDKAAATPKTSTAASASAESFAKCDPTDVILQFGLLKGHDGNRPYWDKAGELLPLWGEVLNDKEGQIKLTQRLIDFVEKEIGGRFVEGGGKGFVVVEQEKKFAKVRRMLKEKYERKILKGGGKSKANDYTVCEAGLGSEISRTKKRTAEEHDDTEPAKRPRSMRETPSEPPKEFVYEEDPNEFYVEETAHKYHDPPLPGNPKYLNWVSPMELRPIPPPPPLPSLPNTGSCAWSFDEENRIIIADFSDGDLNLEDTKFLFQMQERDDITIICRGLLDTSSMNPELWDLKYLRDRKGNEFFHKFRRFDRRLDENGFEIYTEMDHLYSMRIKEFVNYCDLRASFVEKKKLNPDAEEPLFSFVDHQDVEHTVGVWSSALYMIDMDMGRVLPRLMDNFKESFRLPAVLPGGDNCMMNEVTASARPFMGPNLYVTPPASFTHFHQDGHGTVDSGHLCVDGFNEVVMLRRLTERHKKHALWIFSGSKTDASFWDGLYKEPHGDGLGEKPLWATTEMIKECKRMGYCPSVLTLKPGDLIHINKGRLHAFRKLSSAKLPDTDCHAIQRKATVEEAGIDGQEVMCVSVAWDWMNRGVTPEGINRELCTVVEGTILNKKNLVTSLAIPELSMLEIASFDPQGQGGCQKHFCFLDRLKKKKYQPSLFRPSLQHVSQGILPALQYLAAEHSAALSEGPNKSTEKGERLSIAKIPDTQENPAVCPLDPYGNTDFDCKLCRKELSNVYYHCDGCEKLLNKDFNICQECYKNKEFMHNIQMHPSNPKKRATLNHTGNMGQDRTSHCPCKNGPKCDFCGYCLGCSCRCHTYFTVHTRLCLVEQELEVLKHVKERALAVQEEGATISESQLESQVEMALERLKHAKHS